MEDNRKQYFRNLSRQVYSLVITEKLYLDPRLSLDDVANRLEVSRYYVSYAVNNYLNKTFITLVNELRIKEASRLLQGKGKRKIEDISRNAGFTDRTNFHRACKRVTGLTPSALKKKLNKK